MDFPTVIPVFALCLATSFLLSGMEAGVFALNRLRIRKLMRGGLSRARALHGYLERPEEFLWTILVGNTLANFTAACLLVVELHIRFQDRPLVFAVVFVLAVFLFFALCELLPKVLFRTYPNRLCLALAIPFRVVHVALSPIVELVRWLADGLLRWTGGKVFTGHLFSNRDELRALMQESATALTSAERVMVNRVMDLQNITVRQAMLPLDKVVSVQATTPMADVLALYRDKPVTRIPVWQEDAGRRRIAGVLDLRSVLFLAPGEFGATAGQHLKPALFLDDSLRLEEALRRMQKNGQRLAIVLGRDRREAGILCLSDILKVIFGEVAL
jgi:CBS domain containing-hemolysin-like protein